MTTQSVQFQPGDRVSFTTSEGVCHGTVTDAHWGRSRKNVSVRTDDGRSFVRLADVLRKVG